MLNWQIRKHLFHFRDSGRLAVLTCLILHKNNRNRAWPSNKTIIKETGYASATVTAALQWLSDQFAIMPVPYDKRIGEEAKLHQRRIIWQVTGVVSLEGAFHKYLHMTPEGWLGILTDVKELGNNSLSEYLLGEYSDSEYSIADTQEGISLPKGIAPKKDNSHVARKKRDTPKVKEKPYSKWQREDVLTYYGLHGKQLDALVEAWGYQTRYKDLTIPEAIHMTRAYRALEQEHITPESYQSLAAYTRAKAGWKKDILPGEMLNFVTAWRESHLKPEKKANNPAPDEGGWRTAELDDPPYPPQKFNEQDIPF